jgi:type II secretory pathway pseudopilin PulG
MRKSRRTEPGQGRWQGGFSLLEAVIVVAVTLVLVGLTGKAMFSARENYNVTTAARQIASLAQVARTRAMAGDTRFRLVIDTTARTYRTEMCSKNSTGTACVDPWPVAAGTAPVSLPPRVNYSTTTPVSIPAPPPGNGTAVTQATEMTFNSRGLLFDATSGQPTDTRCFYIQGNNNRPMAVCSTMTGQTSVFQWVGSEWKRQ